MYLFVNFFCKLFYFIMTGEPTHTTSEMAQRTPAPYHLKSELSIMLHCQLCSTHYRAGAQRLSGQARHGLQ